MTLKELMELRGARAMALRELVDLLAKDGKKPVITMAQLARIARGEQPLPADLAERIETALNARTIN